MEKKALWVSPETHKKVKQAAVKFDTNIEKIVETSLRIHNFGEGLKEFKK